MLKLAVSAGEISGEMHLARVIEAIRTENSDTSFFGMGSEILEQQNVKIILNSKRWGNLNGFNLPVLIFKSLIAMFTFVWRLIKERPDGLILVDYPDFNLRLAFFAKLLRIPVIYYIPPKLWAWRSSRIKKIKKYVSHVIAIFPFEIDFYKNLGFHNISYFGHPFSDILESGDKQATRKKLELNEQPTIAIFPGSRRSEINFLIETMIKVTEKLRNFQIILSISRHFKMEDFNVPSHIKLIKGNSIEVMQASDYGILKCGTCNLEAAYLDLPHVVVYKTSALSAKIIRALVKIKFYSLVNIIKPNTTVELIQEDYTSDKIEAEITKIISDSDYRNAQLNSFAEIREILGYHTNVCSKVAIKILEVVK